MLCLFYFSARALSTSFNDTPELASRPFSAGRDGFVLSEGAGVIVLESDEHALRRGATPLGVLRGVGLAGEAHHITAPSSDGEGAWRSMRAAMQTAGVKSVNELSFFNAHATSTPLGDAAECEAMQRLLPHASDPTLTTHPLFVTSNKGCVGHMIGAAGGVEAAVTVQSLRTVWALFLHLSPSPSFIFLTWYNYSLFRA